MSKTKQLLNGQPSVQDDMLDADYRFEQWNANRERVSLKTQDSTVVLTELFKSFGEIFSPKEGGRYEV